VQAGSDHELQSPNSQWTGSHGAPQLRVLGQTLMLSCVPRHLALSGSSTLKMNSPSSGSFFLSVMARLRMVVAEPQPSPQVLASDHAVQTQ